MTALNTHSRSTPTHNAGFPPAPSEAHQRAGKKPSERQQAIQQQALDNATHQTSIANYDRIYEGFDAKGICPDDIIPRENVLTFNAWKAKGRVVRKGETGVKIVTWIACRKKDKETGEDIPVKKPKTTNVFHISQTQPLPPDGDSE